MDIKELIKAVENSDMESEAKAEIVEIIEDWQKDSKNPLIQAAKLRM